jgi:outer membrane protein TolC
MEKKLTKNNQSGEKMRLILIAAMLTSSAYAKDLQLENLWKKSYQQALAMKASRANTDASRLEMERSEKHWYPQVYATGNSFVTNDPGANMFGLLSQRDIKQNDFMPDSLNHPSSSVFTKATVGITVPLYEGGQKVAVSKAMTSMFESKKKEESFVAINFYSEFVKTYTQTAALHVQMSELKKVKATLDNLLANYKIGNKSNMLGYSGLLGLKSLNQKLIALSDENSAKSAANQKALAELSGEKTVLNFQDTVEVESIANEYISTSKDDYAASEKINSMYENAKAAKQIIDAEKSRNLPRIGVFGESYAFNGDRKTATGYSAGLYLNWNLFSAGDMGATEQAISRSHAAQYYAEATSQKEKMEFVGMKEMQVALVKTLGTLSESQKLLDEQIKIANTLFRNGMINALQLVEVLSRRVDLVGLQTDARMNLVNVQSQLLMLTNTKPSLLVGDK